MTSRLSDAQKAAARRAYLRDPNLGINALAASYGIGQTAMRRVLKGITRPRYGRPRTEMTTEQMIRLHEEDGITLYDIGKLAGISESGVSRRISRHRANGEGKK